MSRKSGWEQRLSHCLERAADAAYDLGSHDCFIVACDAINAQTGAQFGDDIRGRYKTKAESIALILKWGATFEDAFEKYFGLCRIEPMMAQRGDLCALRTGDGEKHLGICVGERCACLGVDGMLFLSMKVVHCAWTVE